MQQRGQQLNHKMIKINGQATTPNIAAKLIAMEVLTSIIEKDIHKWPVEHEKLTYKEHLELVQAFRKQVKRIYTFLNRRRKKVDQ